MKRKIILSVALLVPLLSVSVLANSAPVVSNVTAAQRADASKLVDIYYDLNDVDGDSCTVWVVVSDDNGVSWKVPALTFTGDVGAAVPIGIGKHIIWDASADIPGKVGNVKARVYADDGKSADSLVLLPGGVFKMGDSFGEGSECERPVHYVFVDPFMIGRYEVTNQQYCEFLNNAYSQNLIEVKVSDNLVYQKGTTTIYCATYDATRESRIAFTGSHFIIVPSDKSNHPVVHVTWFGAAAYCNWRSEQTGKERCYNLSTPLWNCDFTKHGYRLPTEAEWEYAARGGLEGKRFPWGDTISQTQANFYSDIFHPIWGVGDYPYTSPVGFFDGTMKYKADYQWPGSATSYQTTSGANNYGLYDIAGNVWEWCNDWYQGTYYSESPYYNPTGPASMDRRVLRGGNWNNNAYYCRVAYRTNSSPDNRDFNFGFRVVLDLE
jgi:sulfatase modifying factor 1